MNMLYTVFTNLQMFTINKLYSKGSDTLESFLSKVAFESNLRKKLSRIEHVVIVKVSFKRRKTAKVFMTHVQVFFRKSLSKATFERKLSNVSLPLASLLGFSMFVSTTVLCQNNTVRVFAFLTLTVCLVIAEYAAADVSFSTRTGASGTFHTVTFQRHFIWQITMASLWDETFAFHGKPIVLWVQWKVSQAIDLHVGCIECPLNMTTAAL